MANVIPSFFIFFIIIFAPANSITGSLTAETPIDFFTNSLPSYLSSIVAISSLVKNLISQFKNCFKLNIASSSLLTSTDAIKLTALKSIFFSAPRKKRYFLTIFMLI